VKIKNVSPLGALIVPLLGHEVGEGEVIDVSAYEAEQLLAQPRHWELAETAPEGEDSQ